MRNLCKQFISSLVLLLSAVLYSRAQIKITTTLCENKTNPLGVPLQNCRLGWELESAERNQYQIAWQAAMSSSLTNMEAGIYDVWNSSVTRSKQSVLVPYKGKKLKAGETYYWKVRVWDKHQNVSAWSKVNEFTTGLYTPDDWAGAQWIGYEELPDSMKVVPGVAEFEGLGNKCLQRSILPEFRKFFIVAKKIKQARVFITGTGQYEMSINGNKIGNSFLSPGWTYYEKRILYNVYDVSNLLKIGENVMGVMLGNGFYYINRERYFKFLAAFGFPKMICKLKVDYEDGTSEIIVSDTTWKTGTSPIIFSSIYGGEDYDARLEQTGWNLPGFNDAGWKNALRVKAPKGRLVPEVDYPLQVMDTFTVKYINRLNERSSVFDFAQNASGIVELQVKGNRGDTIKLTPAELLDDTKMPNQNASGKPYYYTYILKGDGLETWRPRFSYYGFRYVLVESSAADSFNDSSLPSVIRINLLHTRNSTPANGSINCSNPLFNQINELIRWAIKSNMQSVITDCPHREKLGWLEQDYLMGTSIQYNYNISLLYRKIVQDMMDAQEANGLVPDIAPEFVCFNGGFKDSPEWGSAAVILPWLLYKWYGDKDVIRLAYVMMKKYVGYLKSESKNGILSYGLGDWYDYGPNPPGEAQLTPRSLTATAIYYYDVSLLLKMAEMLHKKEDVFQYRRQANMIKRAFNLRFLNGQKKIYAKGSQTSMAMPLSLGLADEKYQQAILQNLIDSIKQSGYKLTAGDIGFHFLVKALSENNASSIIYEMNHRYDVPGYGYQLKKGATALTESWNALATSSNNHLMLGHIMEWFYSGLAGISQEDSSAAFEYIKICPEPTGDITSTTGNFHSPYGWIKSEWEKDRDQFILNLEIPVNTTAFVYLPANPYSKLFVNGVNIRAKSGSHRVGKENKLVIKIGSGKYRFEVKKAVYSG